MAEAKLRALESMEPDYISVSSESVAEPVVEIEDPIERARNFVEEISLQPAETIFKEPLTETLNEEPHKVTEKVNSETVNLVTRTYTLVPNGLESSKNTMFDISSFLL